MASEVVQLRTKIAEMEKMYKEQTKQLKKTQKELKECKASNDGNKKKGASANGDVAKYKKKVANLQTKLNEMEKKNKGSDQKASRRIE